MKRQLVLHEHCGGAVTARVGKSKQRTSTASRKRMALRPQRHTPSSTGWSGPTGSEESVTRRSSSSTAASGPSLIARSTPSRCHSSATCVGVAPSASSAFGSAPARSSARATEVRPSCAAYLRAVGGCGGEEPLAKHRHALTTRLNYFSSSRAHTIAPTGWLNLRAVSALRSISSIATPTPGGGRRRTSPTTKYTTSFANVFYAVNTRLSLPLRLAVLSRSRGSSCPSHRRTADHLRCARA